MVVRPAHRVPTDPALTHPHRWSFSRGGLLVAERSAAASDLGTVPDLRERILQLRDHVGESPEMTAVLAELEVTYEHLRVAAQEIRAQEEEIHRLLRAQELMRWQQQRVQQMLPAAVVTTDLDGRICAANASAVVLFGADVVQLVRTGLFERVASEDRADLQAAAARLEPGERLRRTVTVVGRDGRSTRVDVSAATGAPHALEISWILVVQEPEESGERVQAVVSEALVDLGALPASSLEDLELLQRAVAICAHALGGSAAVSLSAGAPTAPSRVASSAAAAQVVDGAQLEREEGPSVAAYAERATVVCADLRTADRWPALAADPRLPAVAAVAAPLLVGDEVLGVLTVYVEADPPGERLVRSVELLAAAVAAVLHEAVVRRELAQEAADLEAALQSRATIDQAKGIIMAERNCSAQEAFDHLVDLSSTQHTKLREVARALVEQRSAGSAPQG